MWSHFLKHRYKPIKERIIVINLITIREWPSCNIHIFEFASYSTVPVHGNWGAWGGWSACSKTCGGGTMFKSRTCSNPAPQNGGRTCVGPSTQSQSCNSSPCKGNVASTLLLLPLLLLLLLLLWFNVSIDHVWYINILTWFRGFQDKLLCLAVFSLHPSIIWELKDKENLKICNFDPKASDRC